MKYWNGRLKKMTEYVSGEQPPNLNEYIKLNTNENSFAPSELILEDIKKASTGEIKRYPDSRATEIREIFASQNGLEAKNIVVGNGSDEIFTLIFRGFIEPDGIAAFPYPSYSLYNTLAEANEIRYEKIYLNDDFSYNLKSFLKKKYDLVLIANPNNPTGTYCSKKDIKSFLDKFKGLLVVDEAYIDFYGGSVISLIHKYNNLIVTRSFSKSYSLAGLRIGLAISNEDIINGFMKIKDSYNIDVLSIAGAKAALHDTKGFKYNIGMTINNKEYLETRLNDMGFFIVPSRANFLFVKHPDIPSVKIYEMLKERKILVRYFNGKIQSEYIRISVGTMMEIKSLCNGMESILKGQ